ncbi:MAG: hypothetical protein ABL965_15000 [Nitrospira sp.]
MRETIIHNLTLNGSTRIRLLAPTDLCASPGSGLPDTGAPSIFQPANKIRAEVIYSPRNLCYTCHIESQLFTPKGGEVLMATKKAAAKKPVKKAAAKKKK